MLTKKILIAADHAGVALKEVIKNYLLENAISYEDLGTNSANSVDYPDYANKLCNELSEIQMGILLCGSGIGMSIAANRYKNVRAALCFNEEMTILSRKHNNANILVLGARFIEQQTAIECVRLFLETKFEEGRHQERIKKII